MGAWLVVGGWLVASALAAIAFHLLRGRAGQLDLPADVRQFLGSFAEQMARQHPDVPVVGMVAGRFAAVLRIEGQETPVPLHGVFRHWRAYPDAFPRLLDRLVSEVREEGLEQVPDHLFDDVATRILPQIRTREWLAARSQRFGDAALVHRSRGADLCICYVIDDAWSLLFVTQAHLRQWRRSEEDLYHLALGNLRRLTDAAPQVPAPNRSTVLSSGDGYDTARLLLLDPEEIEGLLVALPERDLLWLGGASTATQDRLAGLMRLHEATSREAAHPVSPHLYQVVGGELEKVE